MAKTDEIWGIIIQLLDIKKLIPAIFAGIMTLLLLPSDFYINELIALKLNSIEVTVQIILYITFWYIIFMACPTIKKFIMQMFILIKCKFEFTQFIKMRILKLSSDEQYIFKIMYDNYNKWLDFTEPDGNCRIVDYCIYGIDYNSLEELISQKMVENKYQNSYSSDTPIFYCRMNKAVYRYLKKKNRGLIV